MVLSVPPRVWPAAREMPKGIAAVAVSMAWVNSRLFIELSVVACRHEIDFAKPASGFGE